MPTIKMACDCCGCYCGCSRCAAVGMMATEWDLTPSVTVVPGTCGTACIDFTAADSVTVYTAFGSDCAFQSAVVGPCTANRRWDMRVKPVGALTHTLISSAGHRFETADNSWDCEGTNVFTYVPGTGTGCTVVEGSSISVAPGVDCPGPFDFAVVCDECCFSATAIDPLARYLRPARWQYPWAVSGGETICSGGGASLFNGTHVVEKNAGLCRWFRNSSMVVDRICGFPGNTISIATNTILGLQDTPSVDNNFVMLRVSVIMHCKNDCVEDPPPCTASGMTDQQVWRIPRVDWNCTGDNVMNYLGRFGSGTPVCGLVVPSTITVSPGPT